METAVEKEKYEEYFEKICPEDSDDVITVCEIASKEIWTKFRIKFDDPRMLAATWAKIFEAFFENIKKNESDYSEFKVSVANRFVIGYDNSNDENDEKQGNFCIFVRHLNVDKKDDIVSDPTDKAIERAVQWNTNNVIDQPTLIREIATDAINRLKEIDIHIASSELIMPIFVKTYEMLIKYVKIKRSDEDEFEFTINWLSLFEVTCRETEDGDIIDITPAINGKLGLKSDAQASSKYE